MVWGHLLCWHDRSAIVQQSEVRQPDVSDTPLAVPELLGSEAEGSDALLFLPKRHFYCVRPSFPCYQTIVSKHRGRILFTRSKGDGVLLVAGIPTILTDRPSSCQHVRRIHVLWSKSQVARVFHPCWLAPTHWHVTVAAVWHVDTISQLLHRLGPRLGVLSVTIALSMKQPSSALVAQIVISLATMFY